MGDDYFVNYSVKSPTPSSQHRLTTAGHNASMKKKEDIKLLRINYLRGPNIWTYRPVLEVWLDLGELEAFPSNLIEGFADRLVELLPALVEHHCGVGERGGFLQRLQEGTWAGHVLEHVVIELLNLAGMPTGFGQTRSTSKEGVYRMVFRARDEQVARSALTEGHRLIMSAINGEPFTAADVEAAVSRIRTKVDDCYLGPSTASIVNAAVDRRIPHIRLNDGNLVQLGYGARQRRIWTAESELTSAIAEGIAGDKDLTKSLLKSCGVPVPEGEIVETVEAAWSAAEDIGLPVVVKPVDGNHGSGVALELNSRDEVEAAFKNAQGFSDDVIVERFIRGSEHRLLVVGGRLVAAARGDVIHVSGDGKHTVAELVDTQLNSDPRRGYEEDFPLSLIETHKDEGVLLELKRQGLAPDSIPEASRQVIIQRNGNLTVDCTDDVHPEVAYIVTLAARIVGLDIAGIDVVAQDISRPLQEQGGAIVEVNAGPGLLMHLKPAVGSPRPVGRDICDHLFPDEEAGRIPIIGVAGSRDTQTIARLIAWIVHLSGKPTGLASRDGLFLDRRRVESVDSANWEAGHRLLINRAVEAAVFENGAASILQDGLAYDRCVVGVVTDLDGYRGLEHHDVRESDDLIRVMRTQVDVVLSEGCAVLNADDARVAALADLCDGSVIFYTTDPRNAAVTAHREKGGKALFVRQDRVVLATGMTEVFLPGMSKLSVWRGRHGPAPDETLLPAIAAAWAMDVSLHLVGAAIEAFEPDLQTSLKTTQLEQQSPASLRTH